MKILPESGANSLKRLVLLLGFIYMGACAFLYFRQAHIIFVPQREVETDPRHFGCFYQDVRVPVGHDGERLAGWFLPPGMGDRPGPSRALLYMHGNGGSIGANAEHACRLAKFGFRVLVFDYRGYGNSSDRFPDEQRVYQDAEAAWSELAKMGFAPSDIILYGHSLGAAVAVEMARRHPEAAGLITESAFTSIEDMSTVTPQYRIFPIHWLLWNRMESIAKVPSLKMPVLIIHGEKDSIIPAAMSEKLYAAAPQPKTLLLVPGAGHEDCAAVGGEKYSAAVLGFAASISQRTSITPPATASR